jgi:hypothetical protein
MTPIQELIEELKRFRVIYNPAITANEAILIAIYKAEAKLQAEREAIEKAFYAGYSEGCKPDWP